ncbi:hypothetical protein GQ600_25262 [Phytophthora cactorum]|nr:hypothetical protein GQ600_25262 [Phytophthora cactorum]
MHQPALTTASARLTPFDILVALPFEGNASGDLTWTMARQSATPAPPSSISQRRKSTVSQNDYADAHMSLVNKVIVLGVSSLPFRVSLGCISKYDSNTQRLEIDLTRTNNPSIWTSRSFGNKFLVKVQVDNS